MRRCACDAWLAACALLVGAGAQAQSYYRFAPPADWIDVVAADLAAVDPPRPESTETLLFDRQINVTADGDEYYQRLVTRVLNSVGVNDYSQIDLVVDPTFQTLDIHWLRIVRNGVEIDLRSTARISELEQETDLRNRIYNGRFTVNVLLSDVRPGDVVDYAYSLRSREQLFPGHFYARVDLGWTISLARQRVRILSPASRPLRYRSSDGSPIPEPVTRGGVREVVLEARDVAGVAADPLVPGWYSQWPFIEVSDLSSWDDVVRRVRPLYRQEEPNGSLVDEAVAAVRAAGGSAEQQALRALQWVQEEIRYTSISIGRGSHEPTAPDTVIERRYGDCKDKSLLLAVMLRALGMEADVALVHSWRGLALDDNLPTPYAFDHAIVRARVGTASYWLDPTGSMQLRPLAVDETPSFGRALVLADGVSALEVIPKPSVVARQRQIAVVLDVRKGLQSPATLEITTRYRGALADAMRPLFSSSTPEQLQNDYVSYIARYYPTAKAREPLEFADDRDGNVLEVRERYSLDEVFVANDEGVLELALHADELYSYGEPLGAGSRQAPLSLEYPIHIKQSVVTHLPEPWPITEEDVTVDNPAFRYRGTVRYAPNTLTLTYDYQALDDHVAASDVARYESDRARMYEDLGYALTYNPALEGVIPEAVAPLPLVVMLLALAGSIWAAVALGARYDPKPRATDVDAPVGIRGWLLLPALGVLISPFLYGWLILQWLPFIGAAQWSTLPRLVAEPYAASANAALLAGMCVTVALLVMSMLGLWLFATKRTSAPAFYIALQWLSLVFLTAFVVWAMGSGLDQETRPTELTGDVLRDLIGAVIWTAYMTSSRRVGATFVRRRKVSPGVPASAVAVP